jgi:hypothetical protein
VIETPIRCKKDEIVNVLPIKHCVLSLSSRHSVGPRKFNTQTRQKVCIWCVFETHTHIISVRKFSQRYCLRKWCPGAQPYFSKISFNYSKLPDYENMEVVFKAVPKFTVFWQIKGFLAQVSPSPNQVQIPKYPWIKGQSCTNNQFGPVR